MKKLVIAGILGISLFSLRAQNNSPDSANLVKLDMVALVKSPKTFTNRVGMVMIPVSDGVWAAKYELTQEAYTKVIGSNPSHFTGTNNPVDSVSWNDAMAFCEKLTRLEREKSNLPTNFVYALPTDAQWEMLVADASLDDAVTSKGKIGSQTSTKPVGSLQPNSLGLYDMRGNVMEFVLDRHDPSQTYRVLRGGAYDTWFEVNLRTNFRHYAAGPDEAKPDYGFRCVLEPISVTVRK